LRINYYKISQQAKEEKSYDKSIDAEKTLGKSNIDHDENSQQIRNRKEAP
jgi:hypothetical protein